MAVTELARTESLLERDEPLADLQSSLAGARTGTGRLVLAGGEAGVGKTALARRFCDELGLAATVYWGECDPLLTPRERSLPDTGLTAGENKATRAGSSAGQ